MGGIYLKMLLGLVGVSGVGKTYFKEKIVEELGFEKVNTIRTRKKRDEEQEGKVGFFKTEDELNKLNNEGKIIYQFKVFGGIYAYLKEEIMNEKNMIFEMHYTMIDDWKKIRPDIKTIYILPKNLEIAKQKVIERETNTEKLNERINEMTEHYNNICYNEEWRGKFDYIVYNNYDEESEKQIIELVKRILVEEQKGKIYGKNIF